MVTTEATNPSSEETRTTMEKLSVTEPQPQQQASKDVNPLDHPHPPAHRPGANAMPPSPLSVTDPRLSISADTAATGPMTPPFSPSSTTPVLEKEEEDLDFTGNVDVNDDLPTENDMKRVADLLVLDSSGQSRPFKDIFSGEGNIAPRQLVIFVRHFFCGNCQEYLRTLSSSITPDSLLSLPTPTFITVIGCGSPSLIDMYAQATSCPFPIYADPTRKLYDILGMTRTLELGKKPGYIQSNLFITSVQSVVQGLKTGNKALQGGDFKQVGGEMLFEDGKPTWVHRMRNTRDHAEVEGLRGVLGLEAKGAPLRKRWSHKEKDGVKEGRSRSRSWGRLRSLSRGMKDKEETPKPEETNRVSEEKKLNERR